MELPRFVPVLLAMHDQERVFKEFKLLFISDKENGIHRKERLRLDSFLQKAFNFQYPLFVTSFLQNYLQKPHRFSPNHEDIKPSTGAKCL